MKNFYTALYSLFTATTGGVHNSFYTAVGGRLYDHEAPQGATYPYAVYLHVVGTQDDTFKDEHDDVLIQFSIFSDKIYDSTEVHDAMTALKALFDDATLTVTGGTVCLMYRQQDGLQREDVDTVSGSQRVWHFHCDYRIVLERT
jgi:hypothetical protein